MATRYDVILQASELAVTLGERQRAAVARALVHRPHVVFAVTGLGGQAFLAIAGVGGRLLADIWTRSAVFAAAGVLVTAVVGALIVRKLDLSRPDARE